MPWVLKSVYKERIEDDDPSTAKWKRKYKKKHNSSVYNNIAISSCRTPVWVRSVWSRKAADDTLGE